MRKPSSKLAFITIMLVGLPLLGAYLNGKPLAPYFKFPPTQTLEHAPFAWSAFIVVSAVFMLMLGFMIGFVRRDRRQQPVARPRSHGRWPWWGWLGVTTLSLSWILAWTRLDWFSALQAYTFIPLWLSYILVVDALNYRLRGSSLLAHNRKLFGVLFPLSALFWWYFEYLNRFVQNWVYTGIEDFGPFEYVVHATLAFSTVLPAVVSTMQLWRTLIQPPARPLHFSLASGTRRYLTWGILLSFSLILFTLGIFPNYLFPFLWVAPMLLLLALQALEGEPELVRQLRQRGWQALYLPALAGLTCGLFWELWNYLSYAKWIYSIPFVDRYSVFEMPIVGYAGYLAFGVECLVVASLVKASPLQHDKR